MKLLDRVLYELELNKMERSQERRGIGRERIVVVSKDIEDAREILLKKRVHYVDIADYDEEKIVIDKKMPIDGEWHRVVIEVREVEGGSGTLVKYLDAGKYESKDNMLVLK